MENNTNYSRHEDNEKQRENNYEDKKPLHQEGNITLSVTLADLSKLVILKFGSLQAYGNKIGVTRSHVCHVLKGDIILKKPSSIQKWADALQINAIVLTQIFNSVEEKKNDS
tara:strand:+ start:103 stop:438 length:336 start_codon:yes stop_codon:yes gene_type:complete